VPLRVSRLLTAARPARLTGSQLFLWAIILLDLGAVCVNSSQMYHCEPLPPRSTEPVDNPFQELSC